MQIKKKLFWDRLGISLSLICAIHCLFFPILLVLLPFWLFIDTIHYWAHPALLLLILPTVFFAGRNKKPAGIILLLFGSGLCLLIIAWLAHNWIGQPVETLITLIGGLLVGVGHFKNHQNRLKSIHWNYYNK